MILLLENGDPTRITAQPRYNQYRENLHSVCLKKGHKLVEYHDITPKTTLKDCPHEIIYTGEVNPIFHWFERWGLSATRTRTVWPTLWYDTTLGYINMRYRTSPIYRNLHFFGFIP